MLTYEPIDPVRFIGNRSSGKMGLALARAAARRGAEVDLILGPTKIDATVEGVNTIRVQTAEEMFAEAMERFPQTDIAILAAAVSDYRPKDAAQQKIKKKSDVLQLELVKNPDIAANLGVKKQKNQLLIGFALETNNEEQNAKAKLEKKNFDFIVLNSLQDAGAGFNYDTNKISILHKSNKIKKFELKSKEKVAEDIVDEIVDLLKS